MGSKLIEPFDEFPKGGLSAFSSCGHRAEDVGVGDGPDSDSCTAQCVRQSEARGERRIRARSDARLAGSRPDGELRQFARASGVLAKNDPLDTRMIASFVAIMPTRPAQPRPPAIERLADAVRRQLNATVWKATDYRHCSCSWSFGPVSQAYRQDMCFPRCHLRQNEPLLRRALP
jgi:hypothetical protein